MSRYIDYNYTIDYSMAIKKDRFLACSDVMNLKEFRLVKGISLREYKLGVDCPSVVQEQ